MVQETLIQIKIKGKVLQNLNRIAEGFSMSLDETATKLLKKVITSEIKKLDKENDEVFETMVGMFVHPNDYDKVKSWKDIGDYLPD